VNKNENSSKGFEKIALKNPNSLNLINRNRVANKMKVFSKADKIITGFAASQIYGL
jgi:hypothetical protein